MLLYLDLPYWALAVYIIACVSDLVDGRIARKYNLVTDFGKFMDPLADKMLVLSAMCYFVEVGLMPGWVVAVVLLREFGVSGLRLLAVEQGIVIAAAWSGKIKPALRWSRSAFSSSRHSPGSPLRRSLRSYAGC